LVTLRDAAEYITQLPKAEHDADEWQAAMEALLLVSCDILNTRARQLETASQIDQWISSPALQPPT